MITKEAVDTSEDDKKDAFVLKKVSKNRCRVCVSFKKWMQNQNNSLSDKEKTPNLDNIDLTNCPPDSELLGRSTWTFLHTMAANYPKSATVKEQAEMQEFLRVFAKHYPCSYCAQDFREWMSQEKNQAKVGGREELSLWICQAHNEVNRKLGKPIFDCLKWKERWRDGWKDGSCG
ncbi:hypothetical protein MERGE_001766 [Pneumocystis wakefieldiae]|uniref:Sulfhydryl oxidase n=1 Tax=Pneumocystis wakefieldiae TaxID=38082 RepID=A0A899FVY4_9ASCO|nr:hypothetical protein MERGE_001766 [Pneumocystis wakefieldiae]